MSPNISSPEQKSTPPSFLKIPYLLVDTFSAVITSWKFPGVPDVPPVILSPLPYLNTSQKQLVTFPVTDTGAPLSLFGSVSVVNG